MYNQMSYPQISSIEIARNGSSDNVNTCLPANRRISCGLRSVFIVFYAKKIISVLLIGAI